MELLLYLVTQLVILWEFAVGKKQVSSDLHVIERAPIKARELET